jgi:RND family efflux transporter MFP subunit
MNEPLGKPGVEPNCDGRGDEMKKLKRLGLAGLLMAAIAAGGCGGASTKVKADPNAAAPAVAVVKVARRNLVNEVEIASEFRPYQEIEVYAKVSGYIEKLNVNWGTHVKQGQVLATLEVPELRQQLEQDEASVRRSESDLERAREELNAAESAYNVAHLGYTRLADVQKSRPGLVAQQDLDASQGKDVQAGASVAGAKASIAAASQALQVSKAALEKDRAMYAYARITAPFDGVVTEINAYTGALLPAGTSSNIGSNALCRLSQNDLLRLVIPLPERAVPDVHIGETVAVKVSTTNKTFPGKIVRFSDQIDTQTRTMHTEVEVPNPKYELVPGMYASVLIPLHKAGNALAIPIQAVQPAGEGHGTVLVVNGNNRIEKRAVTVGIQTANYVEITSGVRENDSVILGTQGQYQDGQAVSPRPASQTE